MLHPEPNTISVQSDCSLEWERPVPKTTCQSLASNRTRSKHPVSIRKTWRQGKNCAQLFLKKHKVGKQRVERTPETEPMRTNPKPNVWGTSIQHKHSNKTCGRIEASVKTAADTWCVFTLLVVSETAGFIRFSASKRNRTWDPRENLKDSWFSPESPPPLPRAAGLVLLHLSATASTSFKCECMYCTGYDECTGVLASCHSKKNSSLRQNKPKKKKLHSIIQLY